MKPQGGKNKHDQTVAQVAQHQAETETVPGHGDARGIEFIVMGQRIGIDDTFKRRNQGVVAQQHRHFIGRFVPPGDRFKLKLIGLLQRRSKLFSQKRLFFTGHVAFEEKEPGTASQVFPGFSLNTLVFQAFRRYFQLLQMEIGKRPQGVFPLRKLGVQLLQFLVGAANPLFGQSVQLQLFFTESVLTQSRLHLLRYGLVVKKQERSVFVVLIQTLYMDQLQRGQSRL